MGVLKPALLFFACAVLQSGPILAAPTTAEVEAVFLFNFSQFVEWPPQAFAEPGSPIIICVLGSDPFGTTLDEVVRGEPVQGGALSVRRSQRVEDLTECQILFISRSEQARLQPILKTLQGRSILTV